MSATEQPTTPPAEPAANTQSDLMAALWAMTVQERIDAMWNGKLTYGQLCAWSSRRPNEVPLLGGEFAWIVMLTPEWAEGKAEQRSNVVHLPERSEHRAAA